MSVFPIFQEGGFDETYFGYENGRYAARRAHEAAAVYGFRPNTVIYYAVDFDALAEQVEDLIVPHFQGIRDELHVQGSPYRVGVYGARNTCRIISDRGLAELSFVSGMSTGYSGNLGYPLPPNWAFDQILEYEIGGSEGDPGWLDIDKNIQSGRDGGQTSVQPYAPQSELETVLSFVAHVEALAHEFRNSGFTGDQSPRQLAVRWLRGRNPAYTGLLMGSGWALIGGLASHEFGQFLSARISEGSLVPPPAFTEQADGSFVPTAGVDWPHLMATLSAYEMRGTSTDEYAPEFSDAAGWAGDAVTLAKDLQLERRAGLQTPAKEWAQAALIGRGTSFSALDVTSDALAWLVSRAMSSQHRRVGAALREQLNAYTSPPKIVGSFGRGRWPTFDSALSCCRAAFSPTTKSPAFGEYRNALLLNPPVVPYEEFSTTDFDGVEPDPVFRTPELRR